MSISEYKMKKYFYIIICLIIIINEAKCYQNNMSKNIVITVIHLSNGKSLLNFDFPVFLANVIRHNNEKKCKDHFEIEKYQEQINISLFPNPLINNLNLDFTLFRLSKVKIIIKDNNNFSKIVYDGVLNEGRNKLSFDMNDFNIGNLQVFLTINDKLYFQNALKY